MAALPVPPPLTEWKPARLRVHPASMVVSGLAAVAGLLLASAILPGVHIPSVPDALLAALIIAILNAVLPPLLAALRLPFTVALGFLATLGVDAAILLL